MPLGREIDDVFRVRQSARLVHEHLPWLHLMALARSLVRFEVVWKFLLEPKGEAATHDADAVDRVDDGFRVRLEDVACRIVDHDQGFPTVIDSTN